MPPRRARVISRTALAMAKAVREMTRARRGGIPFPDVSEEIHELREKRDLEIAGMR